MMMMMMVVVNIREFAIPNSLSFSLSLRFTYSRRDVYFVLVDSFTFQLVLYGILSFFAHRPNFR